jgi:hypothetical protein
MYYIMFSCHMGEIKIQIYVENVKGRHQYLDVDGRNTNRNCKVEYTLTP